MKTILSMSATPVVFHITNQGRAAAILLSDRFELKPSDGTAAEEDISRGTYYLSTTRSKLGAFTKRTIHTNSAIIIHFCSSYMNTSRVVLSFRVTVST